MALRAQTPTLDLKTYDDLLAMPDDGNRYELIFGEIVMSPSPLVRHQWAVSQLNKRMLDFVEERQLGQVYFAPLDVMLSARNVVQPDIIFIRLENSDILGPDRINGIPDLVVEVLSPSNRSLDLVKKAALYESSGVPEYWVVDPDSEQITVNVLVNGRYITSPSSGEAAVSRVLTGFQVEPSSIFARPTWITERE